MFLLRRCGKLLRTRARHGILCQAEPTEYFIRNMNGSSYNILVFPKQQLTVLQQRRRNLSVGVTYGGNTSAPLPTATERALILLRGYVKSNRVRYQDVVTVIDTCGMNGVPLDEQSSLVLLRCCGEMLPDINLEMRRDLTLRVWDLIQSCGRGLSVEHYNAVLSVHVQNSMCVVAEEFLRNMKVAPNEDTYQLLLNAAAEAGDYNGTARVISRMKDLGYPINERTFNALILAHSSNADVDGANAVFETMQSAMIKPTMSTYHALSRGFALKGDIYKLMKTLNIGNLNNTQLMSIVKSLSASGNGEHIPAVLKYLPHTTDENDASVVNAIIELTHLGRAEDAFKIVDRLTVSNPAADMSVRFADFFLTEMVRAKTPIKTILGTCDALISSKKNSLALTKVAEAALRLKDESIALVSFETMTICGSQVRPHFYWPLLLNACANGGEDQIIKLLKHMIVLNVELDHDTLCYHVIPFLNLRDPIVALRKLQDSGIKISDILTPLLSVYLGRGELKAAIQLCHSIKGKIHKDRILKPLIHGYNQTKDTDATANFLTIMSLGNDWASHFLLELLASRKSKLYDKELVKLLMAFQKHNLQISSLCAEVVKQKLSASSKSDEKFMKAIGRLVNPELSLSGVEMFAQIPQIKEMDTEQLENHLIELKSKDMNTRGLLRRLLQVQCRENNLQRVHELREEFEDKNFEWTGGMRAALFDMYVRNNMLSEAVAQLQEVQVKHKSFKLDEHKVIDFATVLIQRNHLERAIGILNEQTDVKGGPAVSRNCWRLLNAVASSKNSEKTEEFLNLLLTKGYCERSNILLGPLIRTHLLQENLAAAVQEFKKYATVYRKTPLKQELICALVKRSDQTDSRDAQEQLQEVLDLVKCIHGRKSADSHLLMALAETGKRKQLHNFFKATQINKGTLTQCSTRLAEENKLTALETILEASRGLPRLNTTPVYNMIMTIYSKSGDCEGAIRLWEKMQVEEIETTQEFENSLTDLLISHKVPLPLGLQSNIVNKRSARS